MDRQSFSPSVSKALIHTFVLAERSLDRSVGKVVTLRAAKPRNSNLIPRRTRHCPVLQSVCIDPAARAKHPGPEYSPPPGAEVTNEWSCISSHPYAFMAVYRNQLILPHSEEEEGEQLYKTFVLYDIRIILNFFRNILHSDKYSIYLLIYYWCM